MKTILQACFPISGLLFVISLMIGSGANQDSELGQKLIAVAWGIRWLLPVMLLLSVIGTVFL